MIDKYQKLKKIAVMDGKYYMSKDILNIKETNESIELTTNREYVIIPKTAVTRIEYYKGDAAKWNNTQMRY